jgi:hypothetical protein
MTTRKTPSKTRCPACDKTDEQCADGRTCRRWRLSWEVCALFGTRPHTIPYEPGRDDEMTYDGPGTSSD